MYKGLYVCVEGRNSDLQSNREGVHLVQRYRKGWVIIEVGAHNCLNLYEQKRKVCDCVQQKINV